MCVVNVERSAGRLANLLYSTESHWIHTGRSTNPRRPPIIPLYFVLRPTAVENGRIRLVYVTVRDQPIGLSMYEGRAKGYRPGFGNAAMYW